MVYALLAGLSMLGAFVWMAVCLIEAVYDHYTNAIVSGCIAVMALGLAFGIVVIATC